MGEDRGQEPKRRIGSWEEGGRKGSGAKTQNRPFGGPPAEVLLDWTSKQLHPCESRLPLTVGLVWLPGSFVPRHRAVPAQVPIQIGSGFASLEASEISENGTSEED